ncbi:MAG: hypothetical protein AAF663_00050 [Planctomycetota bacterium]
MNPSLTDIHERVRHHPPKGQATIDKHQTVREETERYMQHIAANVPDGREKSLALTKIEEAMMWANAGIARNQ